MDNPKKLMGETELFYGIFWNSHGGFLRRHPLLCLRSSASSTLLAQRHWWHSQCCSCGALALHNLLAARCWHNFPTADTMCKPRFHAACEWQHSASSALTASLTKTGISIYYDVAVAFTLLQRHLPKLAALQPPPVWHWRSAAAAQCSFDGSSPHLAPAVLPSLSAPTRIR